jgi:hypothetical protein
MTENATMSTIQLYDADNDRYVEVDRKAYVAAKTKDLIAFGYNDLTEAHLSEQLQKYLDGAPRSDLDVIGMMASRDVKGPDDE